MSRRPQVTESYGQQEQRVRTLCERLGLRLDKNAKGYRVVVNGAIGYDDYSLSLDEVERMVVEHLEAEQRAEARIASEMRTRKRKK